MTLLVAALLALLAGLNARVARSFLYPPALLAGYWAALLALLALSGETFYPVSVETLALVTGGLLAFSLGGLLALVFGGLGPAALAVLAGAGLLAAIVHSGLFAPGAFLAFVFGLGGLALAALGAAALLALALLLRARPGAAPAPDRRRVSTERLLTVGLAVMAVMLPFYWAWLQQRSAMTGVSDFWVGLRYQDVVVERGETTYWPWTYLGPFGTCLALVACYQSDGSRAKLARAVALVGLMMTAQVISMSRTGILLLLFGLVGVAWIKAGRVRARVAAAGAAVALVAFSAVALVLGTVEGRGEGLAAAVPALFDSVRHYLLGGIVALDQVVRGETTMNTGEAMSFRFFLALAAGIGAPIDVPPLVLDYARTPSPTNVYTTFLPYYADYGWLGVTAIMAALGGAATWIYRLARRGSGPFVALYGLLVASILLTNANETFLVAFSYWTQFALAAVVLYHLPVVLPRRARTSDDRAERAHGPVRQPAS